MPLGDGWSISGYVFVVLQRSIFKSALFCFCCRCQFEDTTLFFCNSVSDCPICLPTSHLLLQRYISYVQGYNHSGELSKLVSCILSPQYYSIQI